MRDHPRRRSSSARTICDPIRSEIRSDIWRDPPRDPHAAGVGAFLSSGFPIRSDIRSDPIRTHAGVGVFLSSGFSFADTEVVTEASKCALTLPVRNPQP